MPKEYQIVRCSCGKKLAEIKGNTIIVLGHKNCKKLTAITYDKDRDEFIVENL